MASAPATHDIEDKLDGQRMFHATPRDPGQAVALRFVAGAAGVALAAQQPYEPRTFSWPMK